MTESKQPAPETAAGVDPIPAHATRIRALYANGAPIDDIVAATGLSRGTVYYWLKGGPHANPERALPPLPLRRTVAKGKPRSLPTRRALLVGRIWRAAEKQAREIESRIATPGRSGDARERDARMLAVLVKTLRELSTIDAAENRGTAPPTQAEDDDPPRDIDEFRRELARRIERIVAARATGADRGPGAA